MIIQFLVYLIYQASILTMVCAALYLINKYINQQRAFRFHKTNKCQMVIHLLVFIVKFTSNMVWLYAVIKFVQPEQTIKDHN